MTQTADAQQIASLASDIVYFTIETWNPAQRAVWSGDENGPLALAKAMEQRGKMCLAYIKAGGDWAELAAKLRAVEPH